jgi:hypothetical protein
MEFTFEAFVRLTMDHQEGQERSYHVATEFLLEPQSPLDRSVYLDEDELPNQEGSRVLSNVLIQGLVGNIHLAHDNGWRDSAEHLRWIIGELEKGFIQVANIEKVTLK